MTNIIDIRKEATEAPYEAILWERGEVTALYYGFAQDIDLRGRVVGQENGNAVLWERGETTLLWPDGMAHGLNARGQAAGSGFINGSGQAIVWQDGALTALGANTNAYAINLAGMVAGAEYTYPYKAMLWSPVK